MIETEKFYLFDCGITRYLKKIKSVEPETDVYGQLFESFILQEIRAYHHYKEKSESFSFWRTSNNQEIDLIIGEMDVALEIKSTDSIQSKHLKTFKILSEEQKPKRKILVCREQKSRTTESGIQIIPWDQFCKDLWSGKIY